MSGTESGYGATRSGERERGKATGYARAYGAVLRACYAMSGTEIAQGIALRVGYAMSGTDLAYAATRLSD
eukprot:3177848-Rhodomonas_salina.11